MFGGGARLTIDPPQVMAPEGRVTRLHAWYDSDGTGSAAPVDVTAEADWSSSDVAVASVNNTGIAKGELIAGIRLAKTTHTTVTARFKDLTATLSVDVQKAPLEITCYPVGKDVIRRGKQIDYIVYFSKIGVPDYTYQWETPEGETSTFVNPIFTFKTPGTKIVKVKVTDKAGSVLSTECKPLTVK